MRLTAEMNCVCDPLVFWKKDCLNWLNNFWLNRKLVRFWLGYWFNWESGAEPGPWLRWQRSQAGAGVAAPVLVLVTTINIKSYSYYCLLWRAHDFWSRNKNTNACFSSRLILKENKLQILMLVKQNQIKIQLYWLQIIFIV